MYSNSLSWPELSYNEGKDTYTTLHLFAQIAGKIKLALLPWINHSWHVALTIIPTGITTSHLPYNDLHFQIEFDLCRHKLVIKTDSGDYKEFSLAGLSVADFYKSLFECLSSLNIFIKIKLTPSEIADPIAFDKDTTHSTYIHEEVTKLHKALLFSQSAMTVFRSEFKGKSSPVHFFWGSFDLAVSRFSGRKAPKHPGGIPNLPDSVAQEAYSHEVSSCGFWPGNDAVPFAAFYAYTYPAPEGLNAKIIQPTEAYFHEAMGEFILPYEVVRTAIDPQEMLLQFFRSTYNAGVTLGKWDLEALR